MDRRKQDIVLICLAVACIVVYVIIGLLGIWLVILERRPAPMPFMSPITYTYYVPLAAKDYPQPIEHGIAATYYNLPGACGWMMGMNSGWYYNWSYRTSLDCNIEFVPMIWQSGMVGNEIPPNATYLLGFNECGINGQCPDTPCEAAIGWRALEQTYPDVKLGSPATLGWYGYSHLWWLEEWYGCYQTMYGEPPRLDFVAAHCYGDDIFCQQNLTEVVAFADSIGGLPVWVTEFANAPTDSVDEAQMLASMAVMVEWFKAHPQIDRWAWFALTYRGDEDWMPGSWVAPYTPLVGFDTGELTECGELYRDVGQ